MSIITSIGNSLTLPTANQYVHILDSTRGLNSTLTNSASLTSTAGGLRGRWAGARIDYVISSTTQDVTAVWQIWDGSAWQTVSGGSNTLTAGTLYPFGWVSEAPEWRIYMLAGGTAPGSVLFQATLTIGDRAAGT